jgi:hypothetical protein
VGLVDERIGYRRGVVPRGCSLEVFAKHVTVPYCHIWADERERVEVVDGGLELSLVDLRSHMFSIVYSMTRRIGSPLR